MPTTVANVKQVGVFLAESPNTKPTAADYTTEFVPLQCSRVAGSGLWEATFVSDLAQQKRRLRNLSITARASRQIELWEIDTSREDDIRVRPLFWGELVASRIQLGRSGEQEILTARLDPFHFGEVIKGERVVGSDGEDQDLTAILSFNPMIDGKIVFNRWKPTGDTNDWYHWIDPESTRTPKALKASDPESDPEDPDDHAENEEWDLPTICETLCEIGNEDEEFVRNVMHGNYDAMFTDPPKILNQVYHAGGYIPQLLDVVTQRHGFNWCVDAKEDPDNAPEMKPQIRFYKQDRGIERTVKIQDAGEVITIEGTNALSVDVGVEIGRLANVLTGNGALIEREVTVTLYRGWSSADDNNYDHEDVEEIAQRKWVANEAGDYTDLRTEIEGPTIFGADWSLKRRVIEDCLTLRDGQRRPPFLEYRPTSDDEWLPVPSEWGWRVLHDQIGVYFTGRRQPDSTSGGIPTELITPDVELRLTGTIRGDKRVTYSGSQTFQSPNAHNIEQTIDLSDRYFDKQRMTGDNASILTGDHEEVDDAEAIQDYVYSLVQESCLAEVRANITLFGLHFDDEYDIGDIITKIEGREISFNRSTGTPGKYVQIVGITHTFTVGNQTTVLTVAPHGVA